MPIKQSDSQALGRRGERWFQNKLPQDWIFNPPREDIGIDGLVVIAQHGELNGAEFKVQIKARRSLKRQAGDLLLPNMERDKVRYWLAQLAPTMLAVYEGDTEKGYFCWIRDLFDSRALVELLTGKSKTITLRIPATNQIDDDCWKLVTDRLADYYGGLEHAFSTASIAVNLRPILRSLLESLRGLHLAEFSGAPSSVDEIMMRDLLDVTSHREVILSLRRLLECLSPECQLAHHVRAAMGAYKSEVDTFLISFDELLEKPNDNVVLRANSERMEKSRPKLIALVTEMLLALTVPRILRSGDN